MNNQSLHQQINRHAATLGLDIGGAHNDFYARLIANAKAIQLLYRSLYGQHPQGAACFDKLITTICTAASQRSAALRSRDQVKLEEESWFTSNHLTGMSLYVDRFAGTLQGLREKLPYFEELGVNLLHIMPIFDSPEEASDGGFAVSNFKKVAPRFGDLDDFMQLQKAMMDNHMYLMLDIVLNHTSDRHAWAQKAMEGDPFYTGFFYTFPDRTQPDAYEAGMPEVFPEIAPGSFTWNETMNRWVMTVFNHYQWDLNYTNPEVFIAMLDHIFFYANLGVDILRIDAPAFIWKQVGTSCQNLPEAHTILQLIRQCVEVVAPGMALLGEAIVAPAEIMEYFGTGKYEANECHFAYNATLMALQWDALATSDARVLLLAQPLLGSKPKGVSWITYTRCHDDIGLGFSDAWIEAAGFEPFQHRNFLKDFYSGNYYGTIARGVLFGVNHKTNDARISGSLASLCGLEYAVDHNDEKLLATALRKIILMQAVSFLSGGLPMLYYGDELGYTNDYSFKSDPNKQHDRRWLHRPIIDWETNALRTQQGTIQASIFSATQKLIQLRKSLAMLRDESNVQWAGTHNRHIAGMVRQLHGKAVYCFFNFSEHDAGTTWYALRELGCTASILHELWEDKQYEAGTDAEYLVMPGYSFMVFKEYNW